MKTDRTDLWLVLLCGEVVILAVVLIAIGATAGLPAQDTPGYFVAAASDQPFGEMRHPGYGFLASQLGASATAGGSAALAQGLLHVVAPLILYAGARCGGVGAAGSFALASAALFAQSGLYHLRLLLPESWANSCLLIAFAAALAASGSRRAFWLMLAPAVLFTGAAYLFRPSHLPAILALPAVYLLFAWRNRIDRPLSHATLLLIAVALPFLAQSSHRLKTVGDFNVVSFGGFLMSPGPGYLLTPEIVARMPQRAQPTARAMLAARENAEREGQIPRTPVNSAGERSFFWAALLYFDIYARGYDDFLKNVSGKIRLPGESQVAFNRRLTEFSFAAIAAAPLHWAAWMGGAAARLAGHAMMTNVTQVVACLLLLIAAVPAFIRGSGLGPARHDLAAVCVVALGWLAATGALIVLLAYPATRYIDSAAYLLPAIPLALAIAVIQGLRRRPDAA
jgi:hypothetical protein